MILDFSKIRTQSAHNRQNQVSLADLKYPSEVIDSMEITTELRDLAERIKHANQTSAAVILFMGAHVIKCGLSPYIIDLINRGLVTHIGGNGAVSIHDFELAFLGATSEDVPHAIEDGSFGMWEETGGWMNDAINRNAGDGYGKAIARFMENNFRKFLHREHSVLWAAHRKNIPATIHVTIGADIIHQHPKADFAAIGKASGEDFYKMCESVANLDGGVFINFGSAVTGAEVFLKALSISRNLGYPLKDITTANFDIRPLGNYRKNIGYDDPDYYYRPRKNIVNRPTQNGGVGYHFELDHKISIPMLHSLLLQP